MSLDDYKLSAELVGHSLDVRAVAVAQKYLVSGSRDKVAKIWEYDGWDIYTLRANQCCIQTESFFAVNRFSYSERLTLTNHTNFVSSVCVLDADDWICTGSNDATICVYVAGNAEPFIVLKGHTSTGV